MGQKFRQGNGLIGVFRACQIDNKIILTKLPHHLPAYAAGWKRPSDIAILTTTDGNGGKIPMPVVNRLENCCALGAVGGAIGGIFDVTALIYAAVGAQKRCAHLVAGVGYISAGHSHFCQFNKFFRCHKKSTFPNIYFEIVTPVYVLRNDVGVTGDHWSPLQSPVDRCL